MTPSLYRCPKCCHTVILDVKPSEIRCLRCARLMKAIGEPPVPVKKALQA